MTRHLQISPGQFREQIARILHEAPQAQGSYDPGFYGAQTLKEHAALSLEIIRAVASLSALPQGKQEFVCVCIGEYLTGNDRIEHKEAIEAIRDVAIDGLYEFLDEQIDARNVLYAILLKYKQRSEWYRRSRLRNITELGLEGKIGERALAVDLQEYVLDQGVEFTVEPASVSGEADLILRDSEGRYIIIDAKYIPADATRSAIRDKLASGANQIARYCNDYNEPEGFLVVYSQTPISIRLGLDESDALRYLKIGGRTVYYLLVDIAELPSASRAGRAHEAFISADELVASTSTESSSSSVAT
jgi:hypothetical protein